MRLVASLISKRDQVYDKDYYHKLSSFVYNLLRGTDYDSLHSHGSKFFSFNGVYPYGDGNIKKGDKKVVVFSSPDESFISLLEEEIQKLPEIKIGNMTFRLDDVRKKKVTLYGKSTILNRTPLIVRIPSRNLAMVGYEPKYEYVYWRKGYPVGLFLKQVTVGIYKKYNSFYGKDLEVRPLFRHIELKKTVAVKMRFDIEPITVIGSFWKFSTFGLDRVRREVLKFGIECGFGELNAQGFGFVDVIKDGKEDSGT